VIVIAGRPQQAVHASSDDCQPPCEAFLLKAYLKLTFIMASLRSRCRHYVFVLWFLLSLFLFFITYSQPLHIGCLPYFRRWCGLSANLECRSEICCMRLAENTGCKISPKICHLGTIAHFCWAVSSQLRHVLTIGKILVKQHYLLHTSPQYNELRPTSG